MKKILLQILGCVCLSAFVVSCGKGPQKVAIPYVEVTSYEDDAVYTDYIEVPYREEGGVKIIRVNLNGVGVDMIFDTGASATSISLAEARYLYSKGLITDDDILGLSESQIANGSIVENMVINLREVTIADKIYCRNVMATAILNNSAPLLLGNEVLDRVASYTIDNTNKVIKFKLK